MRGLFDTNKYVGLVYRNKGRDWNGVDCWGLVRLVFQEEYGITLLSFDNDYEKSTDGEKIKEVVREGKALFNNVQKETPEYGDIIVFNMMGNPCHVGIYIGRNRVLHVLRGTEACIEKLNSFRLKGRVEGFYEIRDEDPKSITLSTPIKE